MKEYYLDSIATTPVKWEVLKEMIPYFSLKYHNPSSIYGIEQHKLINEAKDSVRKLLIGHSNYVFNDMGKPIDDNVIFTSGGSEANSMVIRGFYEKCMHDVVTPVLVTTPMEHESIQGAYRELLDLYWYEIPVDAEGFIWLDELRKILSLVDEHHRRDYRCLVSIQTANNEIGTIQNIPEIANYVKTFEFQTNAEYYFHTDATQGIPHIDFSVWLDEMKDIDALTFSGHKIGAPKGIGVLYIKDRLPVTPMIFGTQMDGLRGGTENVPYIVGLKKAIEMIDVNCFDTQDGFKSDLMYELLHNFNLRFNSKLSPRFLPNVLNFTFMGNDRVDTQALVLMLSLNGIYASTGSACHESLPVRKPSRVLTAIGLTEEDSYATLRLSWDKDFEEENKNEEDIKAIVNRIAKCIYVIQSEEAKEVINDEEDT